MADFPIPVSHPGASADILHLIESSQVHHPWVPGRGFLWRCRVTWEALTDADTAQTIVLNTLQPDDPFPQDVARGEAFAILEEVFAGGTIASMTAALGDEDPDGLVDESDVFTGASLGVIQTPAVAEYSGRIEADLSPEATFTSTVGNVTAATTGSIVFCIFYSPLRGLI